MLDPAIPKDDALCDAMKKDTSNEMRIYFTQFCGGVLATAGAVTTTLKAAVCFSMFQL